jgi:hypothetical protein
MSLFGRPIQDDIIEELIRYIRYLKTGKNPSKFFGYFADDEGNEYENIIRDFLDWLSKDIDEHMKDVQSSRKSMIKKEEKIRELNEKDEKYYDKYYKKILEFFCQPEYHD